MFSTDYFAGIKAAFDRQTALLKERIRRPEQDSGMLSAMGKEFLREKEKEIQNIFAQCTEEEGQALTFLYSAMPVSDLLDYPASLFFDYARHGAFLWQRGPFAGRVPEKIFANYVLHHRINNEDITDNRKFFYDKIKETGDIRTDLLYNAAIDVNYWCAGEAAYRSTDERTQNPRTMYKAAIGRCGEESTFTVTALRSMGIPARQVYAPLWSHCDDNHAWVEVWCDGKWHFLGACEPEMRLDYGWFSGPSSRAMMVHSRWFDSAEPEEMQVGRKGMVRVLNHLNRYAAALRLSVKTVDEKGSPVPGAKVEFQVLNQGTFGTIAVVYTGAEPGKCGVAELSTGFGSLYISASVRTVSMESDTGEGWLYGETQADLSHMESGGKTEYIIVMKSAPECWEGWRKLRFYAPEAKAVYDDTLTVEQTETGKLRLDEMTARRRRKEKDFHDGEKAFRALKGFLGQEKIQAEEILHKARGNMDEIVRFLEWDGAGYLPPEKANAWKLEVLNTLREKDYWDIDAETLQDCCINGLAYAGKFPKDVFFSCLVCPRVSNEMLRPCRTALSRCLDEKVKEEIRREPKLLWKMTEEEIVSLPEREYEDLITSSPVCLKSGIGSSHSKKVLCVNLYRSMGIPARLNPFDGRIEYYAEGKFISAEDEPGGCLQAFGGCSLILREDNSLKLSDWAHYALERFEEGGFRRLRPHEESDRMEDGRLELQLKPGIYRVITCDRHKSGNQMAGISVFAMKKGQSREISLSLEKTQEERREKGIRAEEFTLKTLTGDDRKLSSLLDHESHRNTLFLWLETGREPTEHILNELYEKREAFCKLENSLYLVLKKPEDMEDATLQRTMKVLPKLCLFLDAEEKNGRALAERAGEKRGKLPFAVILNHEKECLYSSAGYNVGLADGLLKSLAAV